MKNKNRGTKTAVESNENSVTPLAKETEQHSVLQPIRVCRAHQCNYNPSDVLQWCLAKVMEVLDDRNTHLIGIYGSHDRFKDTLLQKVCRRVHRDKLFDMVLTVTVTKKPDLKKIQKEIAFQLCISFNHKSKGKRAKELINRIKSEKNILILLCDLHKKLDLGKVGIPYGSDHKGCKILLTSTTEHVLSKYMRTQKNFMV